MADFLALPLPAQPSLAEQRRIAAILDQADALHTRRDAELALLRSLREAVFVEMFGDPRSGVWPVVPLSGLIAQIQSGTSPVCEARPATEQEWGVLKLGAVTYGTFRAQENKAFLGETGSMSAHEVGEGDVLMTRKNTRDLVGAVAVVGKVRGRLLLPDLIFRLRLDDQLDPYYLQAMMMSRRMRPAVRDLASGSAGSMPNISQARLLQLRVGVPPLALQRQFSTRLRAIEEQVAVIRRSQDHFDELFASLQARAFSGRL